MSISRQALLSHLDYSAWASQQLLSACSELTAEQLDRDVKTSHGGILRILRHMYYAERVWLMRLRANSLPPLIEIGNQRLFEDPPPEPNLLQLRERWPAVWKSLREYFEASPETELAGEVRGPDFRMVRGELLLHMVNHSALHGGQAIGLLRQFGTQPPNIDLFSFYMLRPQSAGLADGVYNRVDDFE